MTGISYRERVRGAVGARDGEPLFNGTLGHASILTEEMFASAKKCIWILSGKLNAEVYGREEVVKKARAFLDDPDHEVRILVEDGSKESLEDNPLFKLFEEKENAEIKVVPEDLSKRYDFHAWVMDDDSYRFERDKTKCAAIAAFGDKDGAQHIKGLFETIWDGSPVSPQLNH